MQIIQPKSLTIIGDENVVENTINTLKEKNFVLISIENSKKIQGKIIAKLILKEEI